jgi:hypothetical protein
MLRPIARSPRLWPETPAPKGPRKETSMSASDKDDLQKKIEELEEALKVTPDEILVNVVLDMSGSMGAVWDETIELFNEYAGALRTKGEPVSLSLIMFDTEYLPQYFNRALADVPRLTKDTYAPRGMTALFDAVGRCITETAALRHRPQRVMVVTITDGHENSSKEFDRRSIMSLVQSKQAEGWEFLYLSASLTAFQDAKEMGISEGRALSFSHDEPSMRAMRRAMSKSTESYRTKGSSDMRDLGYSTDVSDVEDYEEDDQS